MKKRISAVVIVLIIVVLGTTIVNAQREDNLTTITVANAEQLASLSVLGHGTPGAALWSPDGNTLAIATSLGIWLFDGDDLSLPPRLLASPSGYVATIAFSPDSTLLAGGVSGNFLVLWNVATGEVLHQIMHPSLPNVLAFSPDGRILAGGYGYYQMGGYWDTYVVLWNTDSLNTLVTLEAPTRDVVGLDFSADSTLLAASALDESVRIWNVERILNAGEQDLLLEDVILTGGAPLAFSSTGHVIAYNNDSGIGSAVKLWDVDTETNVGNIPSALGFRFDTLDFEGDQLVIQCRCPSDEGRYILRREVWDTNTMTVEISEATAAGYVSSFTHRRQDGIIVSTHNDGTIHIWDEQFNPQDSFMFFSEPISDVAFTADGTRLAAGSNTSVEELGIPRLFFWDVQTALADSPLPRTLPHDISSEAIDFSPDGNVLASVGGYWVPNITLWQLDTETQRTITIPGDSVLDAAFSPDGSLLAAITPDGTVGLWSSETGELTVTLRDQPRQVINHVNFSLHGRLVAASYTAEETSTIEIWDVAASLDANEGVLYRTLSWENSYGADVPFAFSSSGQLAAPGYGSVLIWDIENQTQRLVIDNQFSVRAIAFSPDGSLLAIAATSGTGNEIRLWDAQSGEQIATLVGHTSWINALVFNPTGTLLASGSNDGTIRLWGIPG
jgi:WD40 repeat protein